MLIFTKKEGEWNMLRQTAPIISIREALHRLNTDSRTVFIDIRDYNDYNSGHISKAVNIPLWKFERGSPMLNNTYRYIIYCEHGGTSMQIATKLIHEGFQAETLAGGYTAYMQYTNAHLS